jgi:phosphohistidine phosphatase SixA
VPRDMAIHLVRHAKAGSRPDWGQPDELRPLTDAGRVQAETLAGKLAPFEVRRVLSSRYARCTQTVEPLASTLGLQVEEVAALAEEADLDETWALVESLAADGTEAVLCSHGNIIGPILDRLHRRGVPLDSDEWSCKKGSVWRVDVEHGAFVRAVLAVTQA